MVGSPPPLAAQFVGIFVGIGRANVLGKLRYSELREVQALARNKGDHANPGQIKTDVDCRAAKPKFENGSWRARAANLQRAFSRHFTFKAAGRSSARGKRAPISSTKRRTFLNLLYKSMGQAIPTERLRASPANSIVGQST
jgi:hypothetical protein